MARIRQARAQRGIAVGGLWPNVTGSASYTRNKATSVNNFGGAEKDLFRAGLDAVWEMDIFGGVRRSVEAAGANVQAQQESLHDVQVSLAAEVALNYIDLRGFQQELVIARNNLQSQEHTAKITRERFNAGFVSALDVANADAQVAST
jgi:outer membrane protein TolC